MSETKINPNQINDGGGSGGNIDYLLSASGITGLKSNLNGFVGGSGCYVGLNNLISTENYDKWEIHITYTQGYRNSGSGYNGIISQYSSDYSGLTFHVHGNGFEINLKNEGDSWIIADQYVNLNPQKGVTYYMKIVYDSTKDSNQYSFYYKTNPDDDWTNSWNYTSSAKNYQAQNFSLIGNKNIYQYDRSNVSVLNDFKFIGDGVTIFDLQTAVAGTDYENVGCFHNTDNKMIWFL